MPLRIRTESGPMQFVSAKMLFGAPVDITLSETAVEMFPPADDETFARFTRS